MFNELSIDEEEIVLSMPLVKHVQTINAHTSDVNSLSFNKLFLASGSGDKLIRLWNLEGDHVTETSYSPLQGHAYSVHCVTLAPNQRWLASSSIDGRVILWDCKTGEKLAVFEHKTKGIIRVCRFSSHSKWIASGSSDNTVCLLDVATKQIIRFVKTYTLLHIGLGSNRIRIEVKLLEFIYLTLVALELSNFK